MLFRDHSRRSSHPASAVKQITTLCLTAMAAFSLLTGCASSDPRIKMVEPFAETNPSPTAIEGMWHYKHPGEGAFSGVSHTVLFKKDGVFYHKSRQGFAGNVDVPMSQYTYQYVGNG